MELRQHLSALDALVAQGNFIEAIEQFFDENVLAHSHPGDLVAGKQNKLYATQGFLHSVQRINQIALHSQAVGESVTMSEFSFDFTQHGGNRLIWNEVIRRHWRDGKVVEEKYYSCECNRDASVGVEPQYVHQEVPNEAPSHAGTQPTDVTEQGTAAEIAASSAETAFAEVPFVEMATILEETVEGGTEVGDGASAPDAPEEVAQIEEPQLLVEVATEEALMEAEAEGTMPTETAEEAATAEVEAEVAEATGTVEAAEAESQLENDMQAVAETSEGEPAETGGAASDNSVEMLVMEIGTEDRHALPAILSGDKVLILENNHRQIIPDNNAAGLSSVIKVEQPGYVDELGVYVDIRHSFISDLTVKVVSPSGHEVTLHERQGGSRDNIIRYYTNDFLRLFRYENLQGEWTLKVWDNAARDTGALQNWRLHLLPGEPDDLKIVEGIGPAIEKLLQNAGIWAFRQLAETSVERVREILAAAGSRYKMHDPTTWGQQAAMAADGRFEELYAWQEELKAGKIEG